MVWEKPGGNLGGTIVLHLLDALICGARVLPALILVLGGLMLQLTVETTN